jgi:hypothetical protein
LIVIRRLIVLSIQKGDIIQAMKLKGKTAGLAIVNIMAEISEL